MTDNIRVNDLCDNFMIRSQTTQYPDLLTEQIETMCSVAANGNPDVLESAEADYIDLFSDLYLDYSGVADFARLMTNTSLVEPPASYDYTRDDLNTRALYDGFAPIPVSEPPFMVNDLTIDKVAEDLAKGTQTLLLGDKVQLVISPDEVMVSVVLPTVNGALPSYQDINKALYSSTGELISANLLPFMPGYAGQDFGSTRFARLEEWPSGEAYYVGETVEHTFAKRGETRIGDFQAYSRSFYMDSRGLFFFDRDKNDVFNKRLYFSTPSFHADAENISEKSVFTYSDYLAEKEKQDYCKRHYCGSFCFTGDTRLEKEDGDQIAFEDLYGLYRSGEELPLLRAWDPDHSVWTYQEPVSVSRHLLSYRNNLQVIIAESGDTMKITPKHFLWIRRGGREYWVQAGKIVNGDELLAGERNGTKVWNKVTSNITTDKHEYLGSAAQNDGALEVFNLSFGTGAGTYLNYAVCGNECSVAHNMIK